MIGLIQGTLVERGAGWLLIETGGIGYEVHVHPRTDASAPSIGARVSLRTHLDVKEDSLVLYGFEDSDELEVFRALTSVTRVGPKLALKVLGQLRPHEVIRAIQAKDPAPLQAVSGVGADTALRIVTELTKKLKKLTMSAPVAEAAARVDAPGSVRGQVASALTNLGYTRAEVDHSLDWASGRVEEPVTLQALLKTALGYFQQKRS